jgi:hypothetical protein
MSRHLLVLWNAADRKRAWRYIAEAPEGTRLEFKAAKRTLPQNDAMWAALSDVAIQKEHNGRKYTPDSWKAIFLHALGYETEFVPTLDNRAFLPLGQSSSDLSKSEMSSLIDFIHAWGAQNGVVFHDKP